MSSGRQQRLVTRHGRSMLQLVRFGLVGGSGVVVNMATLVAVTACTPHPDSVLWDLPLTSYCVRWYHLLSTIAFLVANLWNFQLNRWWTFRSARHAPWRREYLPFLVVGLLGQALGLVLLTGLMHHGSPIELSQRLLDDSTLLRTRLYWGQLIVIAVVTPLSFALNKVWTFKAVRRLDRESG